MNDQLGSLALAALFAGLGIGAYGTATLTLGTRRTSVHLCGAVIFLIWELLAGFQVLSAVHQFRIVPALVVAVAVGAAFIVPSGVRARLVTSARRDLRNAIGFWRTVGWPTRALVLGALALVLLVLARSFTSPPSAWDDLTYHVYKSGSWVHAGHLVSEQRPDAWTFYDYYPASGEVLWSWLLLAGRSGTYLGLGAVFIWSSCLLAAYTAAQLLGCSRERATLAAGAITFVPAVAVFADTSHVDNVMLFGFLVGFVFLLEARREFGWWAAFAGLTGFALTAGVKLTAILLLGLGVIWVCVYAFRGPGSKSRRSWRGIGTLVLALLVASIVSAPWYVRAIADHHNPIYPAEASAPGIKLTGNALWLDIVRGRVVGLTPEPLTIGNAIDDIAKAGRVFTHSGFDLNWPPFPLFYVVLAAIGAALALRSRKSRAPAIFLLAAIGLGVIQLLAPDMTLSLRLYTLTLGRLFLPAFAAFVLLAITVEHRWLKPFWFVIVWVQLFISGRTLIKAWGTINLTAFGMWLAYLAPLLLVAGGATWLVVRRRAGTHRSRGWVRGIAALVAVVALLVAFGPVTEHIRREYRYREYRSLSKGDSYRLHPNRLGEFCSWPLWRATDQTHGRTVALAFGWRVPEGDNQLQYPFLGSRLQNRVTYIPITTDGHIENYVNPASRGFIDSEAWLRRLREQHVDYVALLPPLPPEAAVVAHRPDIFREVARGSCVDHKRAEPARLFRVRSARSGHSPPVPSSAASVSSLGSPQRVLSFEAPW